MNAPSRKDFIHINNAEFKDHCTGTLAQEWSLVAEVSEAIACERGALGALTVLA